MGISKWLIYRVALIKQITRSYLTVESSLRKYFKVWRQHELSVIIKAGANMLRRIMLPLQIIKMTSILAGTFLTSEELVRVLLSRDPYLLNLRYLLFRAHWSEFESL